MLSAIGHGEAYAWLVSAELLGHVKSTGARAALTMQVLEEAKHFVVLRELLRAIVFMLTGVGGFLTSVLFSPAPTMGASAAIFGLMGVLIGFGRRRGGELGGNLNQQMLMWAGIGLVFGLSMPNVNNYAHVGGFITGLGMAWLLPKREGQTQGRGVILLAFTLVVLTVASFGLSIVSMWAPVFEGANVCVH